MNTLRLIGDVHGKYDAYLDLIKEADYSIQLGDLGLDYFFLSQVDYKKHKILAGNHDNYDDMNYPHFLGDYGSHKVGNISFFFVRGGFSIDKQWRIPNISWWKQEELSYAQMNQCIELYTQINPNFVISHECPKEIEEKIYRDGLKFPSSCTAKLLQTLWEIHQPIQWWFAHYHKSKVIRKKNKSKYTTFCCLKELETWDLYY